MYKRALIEAAKRGDMETVQRCLSQGIDINVAENDGVSALHYAAYYGHEKVITLLLADKRLHLDARNQYGGTALHVAAHRSHHNVVRLLMLAGANPEEIDYASRTPTQVAGDETTKQLIAELFLWQKNNAITNKQNGLNPFSLLLQQAQQLEQQVVQLQQLQEKQLTTQTVRVERQGVSVQQSADTTAFSQQIQQLQQQTTQLQQQLRSLIADREDTATTPAQLLRQHGFHAHRSVPGSAQIALIQTLIQQAKQVINTDNTVTIIFTNVESAKQFQSKLADIEIDNLGMSSALRKLDVFNEHANNNNIQKQYSIHLTHDEYNDLMGSHAFEELLSAATSEQTRSYSIQ